MLTQIEIAKILKCSQPTINLILTGKRQISWALAERLAELFPERGVSQWKKATPDDIKRTLSQITKG